MASKAVITINRSRDEVERVWHDSRLRPEYTAGADVAVTFVKAPGDRGTEIHVDLEHEAPAGKLGSIVEKVSKAVSRARVKDDLRRFKQLVETGEVVRSDGTPEGERFERKLKQRPAQPLKDSELEKAGA
jgi:hypothetical protein